MLHHAGLFSSKDKTLMETLPGLCSQDCFSFHRLFPPHPLVWAVDLIPHCIAKSQSKALAVPMDDTVH